MLIQYKLSITIYNYDIIENLKRIFHIYSFGKEIDDIFISYESAFDRILSRIGEEISKEREMSDALARLYADQSAPPQGDNSVGVFETIG